MLETDFLPHVDVLSPENVEVVPTFFAWVSVECAGTAAEFCFFPLRTALAEGVVGSRTPGLGWVGNVFKKFCAQPKPKRIRLSFSWVTPSGGSLSTLRRHFRPSSQAQKPQVRCRVCGGKSWGSSVVAGGGPRSLSPPLTALPSTHFVLQGLTG